MDPRTPPTHAPPSHTPLPRTPLGPRPAPGCRSVAAASRRPRRDNFDDEWRAGGGGSGADFGPRGSYRITVNGREIRVSQDEAWKLALPAALLLGGALFVGPLVLAAALGALAVGAAVATAGVAVTAMFFPFLVFAGLGAALTFGTVAFSTAVFVIPNVLAAFTLVGGGGGGRGRPCLPAVALRRRLRRCAPAWIALAARGRRFRA